MKRKYIALILFALLFALPSVGAEEAEQAASHPKFRTLDELTYQLEVVTRPDGSTVTKRSFVEAISMVEYLATMAAEDGQNPDSELLASYDICTPTDEDYDGDGLIGAYDQIPAHMGEYIADRPIIGIEFGTDIIPSVEVLYTGHTVNTVEEKNFTRESLKETDLVVDSLEVLTTYSSGTSLLFTFATPDVKVKEDPFFKFNISLSSNWKTERKADYKWTRTTAREAEKWGTLLQTQESQEKLEIQEYSGRVTGSARIHNSSERDITMEVRNVKVNVVAYSPNTGIKYVLGQVQFSGPYTLAFGTSDEAIEFVDLSGLNTYHIMNGLAHGWVFDFESGGTPDIVDVVTGENLSTRISTINGKTALLSIHYGAGGIGRIYRRVSYFDPAGGCTTPKAMLETYMARYLESDLVEFERLESGTLVVKRIGNVANVYADKDFMTLTPEQQAVYGRWIVGWDNGLVYPDRTSIDLETTVMSHQDMLFFYYLTAEDFNEDLGPVDEQESFAVANDGTAPVEQIVIPAICGNDLVELDVSTIFVVHEPYTITYENKITQCGGILLDATYHGHRVACDSRNDNCALPSDPDAHGLELKFGGDIYHMDWMDISTLMDEDSADTEVIEYRGYPYYDYLLRFRVSPELLGGYPVRDLQVRNTSPGQQFLVGYTGYNILGQWTDCRIEEMAGNFYNYGSAKVWYKLDNMDKDIDTYSWVDPEGLIGISMEDIEEDFDDANPKRFPFAPEHLDFVDNDGDGDVDEEPLLCPEDVVAYDTAICRLDDRAGWYGDTPNVSMESRWRYEDGTSSTWESLGSVTEYTIYMPGEEEIAGLELRTTNWAVEGFPSGVNFIAQSPLVQSVRPVLEEIEAEWGLITPPMEVNNNLTDVWVETPQGTEDYSAAAAEYRVQIPVSDHYVIWARVRAEDFAQDSFYVEVFEPDGDPVYIGTSDTKAIFRLDVADPPVAYGPFTWTRVNHWWNLIDTEYNDVPLVYYLKAGVNTIRFTVRELGTQLEAIRVEPSDCIPSDLDNDGWTPCEGDCLDKNGDVNPGEAEDCATIWDDNCDGEVNEGCSGGGGYNPKEPPPAAKPAR